MKTSESPQRLYIGTYTSVENRGIRQVLFNESNGELIDGGLAADTENPSFLVMHPRLPVLYATNELWDAQGARVSAFAVQPDGKLKLISSESSGGRGACHLAVQVEGLSLLVANYSDGVFASLPVTSDGTLLPVNAMARRTSLGPRKDRQESAHAHGVYFVDGCQRALAVDLGTDEIVAFPVVRGAAQLAGEAKVIACPAPGSGPRHLVTSPDVRFIYVANELANTVSLFAREANATSYRQVQVLSTVPRDFAGDSIVAEIAFHPNGKSLYVSNRGHDSIAIFRVDPSSGLLTAMGYQATQGATPRHFALHPSGRWLIVANQESDNLVVFGVDSEGMLHSSGKQLKTPSPVCVLFNGTISV